MWHAEIAATNDCSGSTPGAPTAVDGMFAGAAAPGACHAMVERERMAAVVALVCRTRRSRAANRWLRDAPTWLHPEDSELRVLDRRIERTPRSRGREPAHVGRIDDTVIPQACARVARVPLALILVEERLLEAPPLRRRTSSRPSIRFRRASPWRGLLAACSPPITEMRAFGHIQRNRGLYARPHMP